MIFPEDNSRRVGFIRFRPYKHDGSPAGGEAIELPLPPTLTFNDQITYENFDQGMAGQVIEAAASGNLEELAKLYGQRYNPDDANGAAKLDLLASDIINKIGSNAARLANGKAPNPDTRSMFKQPNMRSVGFTFKLVPLSSSEPELIKDIIKKFRKHMYPEKDGDGPNIFYRFPDKFKIQIFLGATEKTEVPPKFHFMYLTGLSVSYGGGVLAKQDSKHWFAETDLQLSFTEEKTLLQSDVEAGW
jgi:hypothetical protein